MASILIILLAYLNLKKKFKNITKKRGISVYIAGYIKKASANWPFKTKKNERCKPQPIHSKPNSFLFKQGSI